MNLPSVSRGFWTFYWPSSGVACMSKSVFFFYEKRRTLKNPLENTLYTCKQPLMMAYKRSKRVRDNFSKFIYQFQPETKTLIRKLERILIKLYRQNVSLLFIQTCLNERLLPTYIYIYIYIYIYTHCLWNIIHYKIMFDYWFIQKRKQCFLCCLHQPFRRI